MKFTEVLELYEFGVEHLSSSKLNSLRTNLEIIASWRFPEPMILEMLKHVDREVERRGYDKSDA